MSYTFFRLIGFFLIVQLVTTPVFSARIKDLTTIAGVRDNQLIGYGLVVGLDGTGDRTNQVPFTDQTFRNMLLTFGVRLPDAKNMQLRNVAAVAVSATLTPFARIGQKIDITVSSLGNAPSLRNGSLLMLPLRGADNQIYAMAQGNVVVSGFGARGADGSKVSVNATASGRIANGATVERTIQMPYIHDGLITLEINAPDFTTSRRVAETINRELGYTAAQPIDAGAVAIRVNKSGVNKENVLDGNTYVTFISNIENLPVKPGEVAARVVVNARSGTVVVGQDVSISPIAVTHGNLSVSVKENPFVSQPGAFAKGRTVKGKDSDISISNQNTRAFVLAPGTSLKEFVDAINRVGVPPNDLISILEAIKQGGALHADLEII